MLILSHRGYWKQPEEKNRLSAFQRSFSLGFGTELDVRDYRGKLVVSHDISDSYCPEFSRFLEIYCKYDRDLYIAINIKADGLHSRLLCLLEKYDIENYFVFDMSIPDALGYLSHQLNTFTRQSEFEMNPSFYEQADGVWMDEFEGHWITAQEINRHLHNDKMVCIVSPELHQRDHLPIWEDYKVFSKAGYAENMMLCTDLPEEAKEYFDG
jgi:glycerophosphoryl diester phosphodiesterase